MKDDKASNSYPFVTRSMLNFENGVQFTLRLQVQAMNSGNVTVRGMTKEGIFTFRQTLAATSDIEVYDFRIPDVPIMVSVVNDSGTGQFGSCFASLSLMANRDILSTLCSGLVYDMKAISWPNIFQEDKRPGGGAIDATTGTDPAAGAESDITVPANEIWLIRNININMTTSATVANRRLRVQIADGQVDAVVWMFGNTDQPASTTYEYSFAPYGAIPVELNANKYLINLPSPIFAIGGTIISTSTVNMQAGDNISAIDMIVEKWFQF